MEGHGEGKWREEEGNRGDSLARSSNLSSPLPLVCKACT